MYVVTGATGQLGSRIVRSLLDRVPAERIGVSVRDATTAADLTARGVRVREADFLDPDALAHAFEGAERVLVVSAAIRDAAQAAQAHRAAVDAARAAGAERVLYTSHQAASPASQFSPARGHAATEEHLAAGGPFTALRNGFYATTVPYLLGDALTTGELVAPADGPVSWTAHDDLAEAAARTLLAENPAEGPTPPLTGPDALDLADVASCSASSRGVRCAASSWTTSSGSPTRRPREFRWAPRSSRSACSGRPARGSSPSSTRPCPNSSGVPRRRCGTSWRPPSVRGDRRSLRHRAHRASSAGTRYA